MSDFKKHTVELDVEKVERFKTLFPGTSLKWFFDSCLSSFVRHVEDGKVMENLQDAFDKTAKDAIINLHEGGRSSENAC